MSGRAPNLLILGTGGTIAGLAGSATAQEYQPGQIGIEAFLAKAEAMELGVRFSGEQIANIGSEDISPAIWAALHTRIMEAMADRDCDGIIITHGTDTLDETAFVLDLTLPTTKPVVLVGAMRPADSVGYDGYRNFANAVQVAKGHESAGRGVLVVMGDRVFAARDIRKSRTRALDAFSGFPRASVGIVTPSQLDWFGAPWRVGEGARLSFTQNLPDVPILYVHAGMGAEYVDRLCPPGNGGIVIAGAGEGNMPEAVRKALAERARQGLLVVRSTRLEEGLVDREIEDETNGFIASRALGPVKARLLLALLIANGVSDLNAIQAAFDRG